MLTTSTWGIPARLSFGNNNKIMSPNAFDNTQGAYENEDGIGAPTTRPPPPWDCSYKSCCGSRHDVDRFCVSAHSGEDTTEQLAHRLGLSCHGDAQILDKFPDHGGPRQVPEWDWGCCKCASINPLYSEGICESCGHYQCDLCYSR